MKRGRRILCLDGGGTRGVATLAALQIMEERTGKLIADCFDIIAGVSTGALIAVALGLKRMRVAEVRAMYYKMARICFAGGAANPVTSGSYYKSDSLAELLRIQLGEGPMAGFAPGPHVIVVANDCTELPAQRILFTNYKADMWATTVPAWKAVLASCSAPLYFPHVTMIPQETGLSTPRVFIDGAVGHNNPLLIAVGELDMLFGRESLLLILSIGTGQRVPVPNPALSAQSTLSSISERLSDGYFKTVVTTMSSVAPTLGVLKMMAMLATDTEQSDTAGQLMFPAGSPVLYARVSPKLHERASLDEHQPAVLLALEQSMVDGLQGDIDFARVLTLV